MVKFSTNVLQKSKGDEVIVIFSNTHIEWVCGLCGVNVHAGIGHIVSLCASSIDMSAGHNV